MCLSCLIMMFLAMSDLNIYIGFPQSAKGLQNNKDSRILWAKDDLLLTTGFDMVRNSPALHIGVFFKHHAVTRSLVFLMCVKCIYLINNGTYATFSFCLL